MTQVGSKHCGDILKQFMCSANDTLFCWVVDFVLIQFGIVFVVAREAYKYDCSGDGSDGDRNCYQTDESKVLDMTCTLLRTSYSVVN
jgi:hypothetical protein